jgi:hypothetical protein
MKIITNFLRMSFFVILFFVSNKISAEVRKDIVSKTTKIIEQGLFPVFYENLMQDIGVIYTIAKKVSNETGNNHLEIDEKIAEFKDGQFILRLFENAEIISKEKQIKIFTFILYNAFVVLSNEAKREEVLKNDNLQGVLMLLAMSGISVRAIDDVKKIVSVIYRECQHLKNNAFDDLTYQQTVYEILQNVSRLAVEKNIFTSFADRISFLEKDSLLKEINLAATKKFKKTK